MNEGRKIAWEKLLDYKRQGAVSCGYELAKKFCRDYPESAGGWLIYAWALWEFSRFEDAEKALKKARKLTEEENTGYVYAQYGHFYREKGEIQRAERWYRKAVSENPTSMNYVFLGTCCAKQGKLTEAKEYYLKSIELGDQDPDEAYLNLGLISRAEEKYREAEEYFEKALAACPDYQAAEEALNDIRNLFNLQREDGL